ncbi:hypothetical protein TH61_08235 [Rufibacter sp. DG15C]|uniref:DUF1835 domain-containing protein n=1 Tax=Rufibacter sp. DG15C TaxID=1379909 RepID=UPI00078C3ABA|nr:DUF1835 domain-containing protein [Rufibacter sp. DG15C]AMM51168.1 hypothetical protein TH61_08235 [Rufibacter sp. DG15C]
MQFHVLNGDSLAATFKETNLSGEVIVCREGLVNGPVASQNLAQFWEERAAYLAVTFGAKREEYFLKVAKELEKLIQVPANAEVCLWFEDDLFCQANLWFILSLLATRQQAPQVYRVFPIIKEGEDHWQGFGRSSAKRLEQAYQQKVPFAQEDVKLGNDLWRAYQQQEARTLLELSTSTSACFHRLQEVCQAQVDRVSRDGHSGRPERVVREILASGITHFPEVFKEFFKREGVYGFGDVQVKHLYNGLRQAGEFGN